MATATVRCTTPGDYASKSIEALNSKAEVNFDHDKPLDKWLKSAHVLYNQAQVQKQEGTDDTLRHYYVLMLRYVDIVCNEIPNHPGYVDKGRQVEHKKIMKTVPSAVEDLEAAKEKLRKQYETEFERKMEEHKKLVETRKREKAEQDVRDAAAAAAAEERRQAEMEARAAALTSRPNISVGDAMLRDG
eukprot:CAMPEP_0196736052 /NCGR_PEP_ID=MMETSP1091-20130531/14244_1 /TAXON_ID=302021 /ORGANISM="Rhodomonas sp., Strain CCMP768" /LENGTH=187 /DNA_ID=CAMNT_0042079743 /DNA_START=120 /DNA_END=679 /DNA_ORIENTATION=+